MPQPDVSPEVRRFILTSVPSVPYLEALLLLRGQPQQAWEASLVARRLYLGERQVQDLLQMLVANGVASAVPLAQEQTRGYIYQPVSTELAQMLDQLADVYATHLVTVTDLIHSRTDKRAQQFADAFVLRKDNSK